ncbi:MAG TPA: hypothetical protein VJV23_04705 [Candidatus Polarisedimenticolia bacterium]|nr:hypothetical protein [Candidatus Polarisedimenticolia bacterium]
MIERGYFRRALHVVMSDLPTYVLGGLVLQFVSTVSFGLMIGPSIAGIVWVTLRHLRGEEVSFGDLFRGFEEIGPTFAAGAVFGLAVGAGLALLAVPGILLGGMLCFAFPFIVDRNLSAGEAMTASRRLAGAGDLLDRGVFFLLALLVGVSGVVVCLVGLLFTWPLMWAAVAVAYEDMTRGEQAPPRPA